MRSRNFSFTCYPRIINDSFLCYLLICYFLSLDCERLAICALSLGSAAPDFTLGDQYDVKFHLSQFREQNVLLLGCVGKGLFGEEDGLHSSRSGMLMTPVFFPFSTPLTYFFCAMVYEGKRLGQNVVGTAIIPTWRAFFWTGRVSRQCGIPS